MLRKMMASDAVVISRPPVVQNELCGEEKACRNSPSLRSNAIFQQKTKYFYGYNIVAAGFIIQAVCIGAMFTYGVFFKEFQAEFGWSRAAISGASSLAFLTMGLVGVIAGKMNDWIGPKVIIVMSGISLGIGYLLMSGLQALWQLYLIYGILVGIGFSTHDVITLSTVARWFIRRRGGGNNQKYQ